MAEKTVAFIVARHGSSRMPGKHFRHIGPNVIIKWIIDKLKQCTEIDEIVIATVNEIESISFVDFANAQGVKCFFYDGDVEHVTSRLCEAAEYYDADICLLISGDCPLVYGPVIDDLLQKFKINSHANVLQIKGGEDGLYMALHGVMIDRRSAWQLAEELSIRPELKEHQFPAISLYPEKFNMLSCALPDELYAPEYRLSVDTWSDLVFFNAIYAGLEEQGRSFDLPNALQLLKENDELKNINAHVHQRTLKEVIHSVLIILDDCGENSHDRLQRIMTYGLQVVEHLSWPVSFLVNDRAAVKELSEKGFTVYFHSLSSGSLLAGEELFDWKDICGFDIVVMNLTGDALIDHCLGRIPACIQVMFFDMLQEDGKDIGGDDSLLLVEKLATLRVGVPTTW